MKISYTALFYNLRNNFVPTIFVLLVGTIFTIYGILGLLNISNNPTGGSMETISGFILFTFIGIIGIGSQTLFMFDDGKN